MKNYLFLSCLLSSVFLLSGNVAAEPLVLAADDSIESVLRAYTGKRVSLRTKSGAEISGTVVSVNAGLTHLGELSGKEYYDAVLANKSIESIVIRVK